MSEFITKFETSGECEIDVQKVVAAWDDNEWCISQWRDDYKLYRGNKEIDDGKYLKVQISENQAHELIEKLKLVATRGAFSNAYTWRQSYGER